MGTETSNGRVDAATAVLAQLGLALAELPIAFGVGFAAFEATFLVGCHLVLRCVDTRRMLWVVVGLVLGPMFGLRHWLLTTLRLKQRWRTRLLLDSVALTVGLLACLGPQIEAKRQEAAARARTAAANARFASDRLRWIEPLKAKAHGPVGEMPPMLEVADSDDTVRLTRRSRDRRRRRQSSSGRKRSGRLARPRPVKSPDDQGHRYHRVWRAPGQSELLSSDGRCAADFAAPRSNRVGDGPRDEAWWSDSAFTAPDGRAVPLPLFGERPRSAASDRSAAPAREPLAPR